MFVLNMNKPAVMHDATLVAERLCASYWAGFSSTEINQNPKKLASFYKESGHR